MSVAATPQPIEPTPPAPAGHPSPDARGLDLLGGLSNAPRDRPEKAAADLDTYTVHGVSLMYKQRSIRDSLLFKKRGRDSCVRLGNERENMQEPIPVHNNHTDEAKDLDPEGLLYNFWTDSKGNPRASWALDPYHPKARSRLFTVQHNPRAAMMSIECDRGAVTIEKTPSGAEVTDFKDIRCFALVSKGGLTSSISQSASDEMETQPIQNTIQLRAAHPDVAAEFEAELMKQCGCAAGTAAEASQEIAKLREENAALRVAKDEREETDRRALRGKEIEAQWATLTEEVDASSLPEGDDGDYLKRQLTLDSVFIDSLIDVEDDKVKEQLEGRARLIKSALKITQSAIESTPTKGPAKTVVQRLGASGDIKQSADDGKEEVDNHPVTAIELPGGIQI